MMPPVVHAVAMLIRHGARCDGSHRPQALISGGAQSSDPWRPAGAWGWCCRPRGHRGGGACVSPSRHVQAARGRAVAQGHMRSAACMTAPPLPVRHSPWPCLPITPRGSWAPSQVRDALPGHTGGMQHQGALGAHRRHAAPGGTGGMQHRGLVLHASCVPPVPPGAAGLCCRPAVCPQCPLVLQACAAGLCCRPAALTPSHAGGLCCRPAARCLICSGLLLCQVSLTDFENAAFTVFRPVLCPPRGCWAVRLLGCEAVGL